MISALCRIRRQITGQDHPREACCCDDGVCSELPHSLQQAEHLQACHCDGHSISICCHLHTTVSVFLHLQGQWKAGPHTVQLSHGANVARMPAGAYLHSASLTGRPPKTPLSNAGVSENSSSGPATSTATFGILGLLKHGNNGGHVILYGDSNCLDSSHMNSNCYELLHQLLQRVIESSPLAFLGPETLHNDPWTQPGYSPPLRRADINFTAFSRALSTPLQCYSNAQCPVEASAPAGGLSVVLAADGPAMCAGYGAAAAAWKVWSEVDSKLRTRRGGGDAAFAGSDAAGNDGREGGSSSSAADRAVSSERAGNGSGKSGSALERPVFLLRAADVVSGFRRGPLGLRGAQLVMLLCVVGCFLLVAVWMLASRGSPRTRTGPRGRSTMSAHRSFGSMSPDV